MQATTYQADLAKIKEYLLQIIQKQADTQAITWLNEKAQLTSDFNPRSFYIAFGAASRFFNKQPLSLSGAVLPAAKLRQGFQPDTWNLLQTARTCLLLHLPHTDEASYLNILNKLFETADMDEQVALYAALPLLPHPEALVARTADGIRTNMTTVFDAIALHNPYPADYLPEEAWNQMVLKAVFMQRPLYHIDGADQRANDKLARILIDFAHERWAAHRQVMPELWYFIAPYLNVDNIADIEKAVDQGEPLEKEAVLLACAQSPYAAAKTLLAQHPNIEKRIDDGTITWQYIGQSYHQ